MILTKIMLTIYLLFFTGVVLFAINWVYRTVSDRQGRLKALDKVLELKNQTGKKVLNISCGNTDYGDVNADIINHSNVSNFVLVEPNKPLPFKDKEFGVVFSCHTIEHTSDPNEFERELRRVGDHLVLLFPHPADMSAWTLFHKWVGFQGKWIKNPLYQQWVVDLIDRKNWWREPKNLREHAIKIGLSQKESGKDY